MHPEELIDRVGHLLGKNAQDWNPQTVQVNNLAPDGSTRRFFRFKMVHSHHHNAEQLGCLAVLPPADDPRGLAEANSFAQIGRHLRQRGIPTPAIYAHDPTDGLVLCEDMGDKRLHDRTQNASQKNAPSDSTWQPGSPTIALYQQSVRCLAQMQVRTAEGFDPRWCYGSPCYDSRLMQESESGYFLRACCSNLLELSFDHEDVLAECSQLAEAAATAPAHFFLHRDFQCRNIMLREESPWVIDFQSGTLGPLGYDLASLLLDPYAALPADLQEHLLDVYLEALQKETLYDSDQFRHEYHLLSLQRNLQILGAFAFLSQVRGKLFFAQFIRPALLSLAALLAQPASAPYSSLRRLCGQCLDALELRS